MGKFEPEGDCELIDSDSGDYPHSDHPPKTAALSTTPYSSRLMAACGSWVERPSGLSRELVSKLDFGELVFNQAFMDLHEETIVLQTRERELICRLLLLESIHGRLCARLDAAGGCQCYNLLFYFI
jgi:hypothetical protein